MGIVPTIIVFYLWYTCSGQSHSPIFTVSIFSMELRPCLLSIFFGKYTVCSLSFTLNVTFPLLQSITAPTVLRKGLPRIMDMLPSSGMSSATKSVRIKQLATSTGTSSQIPIGAAVDLSAILREIYVGISFSKQILLYGDKGITLTPAPRSQKVVLT